MKKSLTLIVMTFILAILVSACAANNSKENGGSSTPAASPSGSAASPEAATPAPTAAVETELTITHQLGETKVKKNPQTVVVFDFGALDSLDKLGVEVAGVPQANIPPYLSKYEDKKYANVGSLKEPDFEAINKIKPDLIIISGRQSEAYAELSKIAPTIYIGVDTKKYMESFTENMKTLGKIFDKEAVVDQELAAIDQSIQTLHAKASTNGKALIILSNGGKISAYGAGSRFGILHDVFGFAPVDDNIEVTTHGMSISFEYIVEKDPDYLFVIDRDGAIGEEAAAKKLVENELMKNTKAMKNGHIVYLDSNYWYLSGGGLLSVSEMVKEVDASIK
ncbi:siderophore ABC transporter substrate-binding protein [Paenibacillus eucommiae]|uniref:Iron complex transport system substrate-binding protein n=1 Tax=Paenibacillus eucommiae TaxID=1355755 RepID=A0ABS4ITE5_9BACL|nr:siderophore ABC transporter substrate-binding protein [Paenibacillus eucommiae]MBP1990400.1 iron complex transport system substrate-binding protein [Paenibacillus eucommiae]